MGGLFLDQQNHKITFKTIEEQMAILEDRGLVITDRKVVSKYLLTGNYYNIINGYSKYFQINENADNDQYIENANFDEVSQLYSFDKELKQTLFNSVLHAEHHLKSILAHRFAEAYQNIKYAYLNIECYDSDSNKRTLVLETIAKLSRLIENKIKHKDNIILHYVKEYDDIPIWVLVDFLDFGTLGLIIKNLPVNIQNKIARDLTSFIDDNYKNINQTESSFFAINNTQFTPKMLNSFVKNIRETRNVCAHNNRLLDFNCKSDSVYYPGLHDRYDLNGSRRRRSVYSTIVSLQCFLSKTEYAILCNTFKKRFHNLSNHLTSISILKITRTLGFPDNWDEFLSKKQ